jgi:hypothetical protein
MQLLVSNRQMPLVWLYQHEGYDLEQQRKKSKSTRNFVRTVQASIVIVSPEFPKSQATSITFSGFAYNSARSAA